MQTLENLGYASLGVDLALMIAGVVALAIVSHAPDRDVMPWQPGELTAEMPVLPAQDTVVLTASVAAEAYRGRRSAPGDQRGQSAGYQPKHGLDEVPPSIRETIERMRPGQRAKELVRQLGQRAWWPWGDVTDRRMRIRLRAHAIAARHGRTPWLGMGRAIGGAA